jgi:hypothetical protein
MHGSPCRRRGGGRPATGSCMKRARHLGVTPGRLLRKIFRHPLPILDRPPPDCQERAWCDSITGNRGGLGAGSVSSPRGPLGLPSRGIGNLCSRIPRPASLPASRADLEHRDWRGLHGSLGCHPWCRSATENASHPLRDDLSLPGVSGRGYSTAFAIL